MIDGRKFIETVKRYYSFLVAEFHFLLVEEEVRGSAFFNVRYRDQTKVISISYENAEDYFLVNISILQNGEMPDFDDKSLTFHLSKLNSVLLAKISKDEIISNNEHFSKFHAQDELEGRFLKSAKELRLCLKHFHEMN